MKKKIRGAAYFRDLDKTRFLPYEDKFAGFFRICAKAKQTELEVLVVASPEILGDDYEELIANLRRCAEVGIVVAFSEKPGL